MHTIGESSLRAEAILDQVANAVIFVGAAGTIRRWNLAAHASPNDAKPEAPIAIDSGRAMATVSRP
jgi:hypothetical protein